MVFDDNAVKHFLFVTGYDEEDTTEALIRQFDLLLAKGGYKIPTDISTAIRIAEQVRRVNGYRR